MRITESRLRRIIRSVIKENYEYQIGKESRKESLIKKYRKDRSYWNRYLRNDFYDLSVGDSVANEIKSTYYPRWEKQDFIDVIIAIDGSYDY